jgi:hypothetical protein
MELKGEVSRPWTCWCAESDRTPFRGQGAGSRGQILPDKNLLIILLIIFYIQNIFKILKLFQYYVLHSIIILLYLCIV